MGNCIGCGAPRPFKHGVKLVKGALCPACCRDVLAEHECRRCGDGPAIVATPGVVGGQPRLVGTRFYVRWWAANSHQTPAWWAEQYPKLTQEQIAFMLAVVDGVRAGTADRDE